MSEQYRRKPPIPKRASARPPPAKPSGISPLAPPLGIDVPEQPAAFTSQALPVAPLAAQALPAGAPTGEPSPPSPPRAEPPPTQEPPPALADSARRTEEAEPGANAASNAHATLPSPSSAAMLPPRAEPGSSTPGGALSQPLTSAAAIFKTDELWSGKLRVTGEIDRGGMSYILRGTDTTLRRELALKVSPMPRKQLPGDQLARFIEEAQITAQLEHPNVVPVHELGLDAEGRMYFSMKLVRGQSLESILEGRRAKDQNTLAEFGLRRLLDVFLQICQAIEYAHARGVIHRDLKPANIMVGDFGEVLVMDWGVAKVVGKGGISLVAPTTNWDSESPGSRPSQPPESFRAGLDVSSFRAGKQAFATQSGTLIGTPAYMSPEQAQGRTVDERADLYALGVILYEILCGELPFDDEDPSRLIVKKLQEQPKRPSEINRAAPLALETLALRLLAKEPARRTLTIPQIRTHVQNYIEGIARDYRQENLWSNALWILGGLGLFAFLVWYLTGQSIASRFVMTPATVFNAAGWFLLVVALKSPLWAQYLAIRPRLEPDRFRPPTADELFVSGYLANRTFAAALAPIFQLVFIVEIVSIAVAQASRGEALSSDFAQRITNQLRGEWAQSLIVILIFLFLYLFFLSAEVRFARQIDRYDLLIGRPRWEAEWPFFLIILLLLTIGATDVLDWALAPGRSDLLSFLRRQVLTQPLDLVEIAKTLVFQGTFLLGFVVVTVVLSFRFAEVLAALRLAYQPADEASVANRAQYFLRSVAIFRVARVNWLYGGAMIGGLTAMTVLSQLSGAPLVKQVLYILGPSLIGFIGYGVTRRHLQNFLAHAPAVRRLLEDSVDRSQFEQSRVAAEKLAGSSLRYRLAQLALPVLVIVLYLIWTGSGLHQHAIQQLVMPVTTKGWLLILPYVLVLPVLLFRDRVELWLLRRRVARQSQTENV